MIRIFLDEKNPEALKKPNSKKKFFIYGLLIRNEKQYIEIKKKFHQFIDKQPNFNWAYQDNIKKDKKLKQCECENETILYYSFKNNDLSENIKHPEKEILKIDFDENIDPNNTYEEFLKTIDKDVEMFVTSFSKEERSKDSMFNKKYEKHTFLGKEYANPVRRLLINILISTGKILNRYEPIEIIFDRINYYNNENYQKQLGWFLKYCSAVFLNINDLFRSKNYKNNKNKINECLLKTINYKKNLYLYRGRENEFSAPEKHSDFNNFLTDMWYFENKNILNIEFLAPQFNNEFTIIADWIGKVFNSYQECGKKEPKFIKFLETGDLIYYNYSFYNRFIKSFIEPKQKLRKQKKNFLLNQHKLFCKKLNKCNGCYNDQKMLKNY